MPHSRWHSGVKPFVEFCCRRGDLGYTEAPAARAEQGQMAQRRVQASPPAGYRKEIAVETRCEHDNITLTLSGRIDGLWEADGELHLEEIKSTYFQPDTLPLPIYEVHQAQAICYAAMLPDTARYTRVWVRVTYFQLQDETVFIREQCFEVDAIQHMFDGWISKYCAWLKLLAHHRSSRDLWSRQLQFPFGHYRRGQRALAVTSWRYMRDGKIALMEAPTGAGKTISFLFPALKRFDETPAQRVFYLTAKNSGRRTVEQTLARLQAASSVFSVYLTAKTQLCPCLTNSDDEGFELAMQAISPPTSQCERCTGYFDRRQPALEKALRLRHLPPAELQQLAEEFKLCPHQLALDLCEWADLITCDFNYLFDPFTRQSLGDTFDDNSILLVDESHNLPERARSMYTCSINSGELQQLLALKPSAPLKKPLRVLMSLCAPPDSANLSSQQEERREALDTALLPVIEKLREWLDEQPQLLLDKNRSDSRLETWLRLFAFQRALQNWGNHYQLLFGKSLYGKSLYGQLLFGQLQSGSSSLGHSSNSNKNDEVDQVTAYCLDPGYFLAESWKRCASALLFSGTLQPHDWYAQTLGLQRLDAARRGEDMQIEHALENTEARAAILALPMQYQQRQHSLPAAIPFIQKLLEAKPGRYLIAAASFEIIRQLGNALRPLLPVYQWLEQIADTKESARQQFLNSFIAHENCVALVISGGVFAEGIDLPEHPLAGVIQVGLPMPAPSDERKHLQQYYDTHFGQGFEYTYIFPAIARTLQTCGRLLRKDGDKGTLLLIDARYLRAPYKTFLPQHWIKRQIRTPEELAHFATTESV